MAKKSKIAKNKERQRLVEMYADRRAELALLDQLHDRDGRELLGDRSDLVAGGPVLRRAHLPLEIDVTVAADEQLIPAAHDCNRDASHRGVLDVSTGGGVEGGVLGGGATGGVVGGLTGGVDGGIPSLQSTTNSPSTVPALGTSNAAAI